MRSIYVVTMWSGGRPAKKWKADEAPELLTNGTGVEFTNLDTKLRVRIIGSISVEEFESGKEDFDAGGFYHDSASEEEEHPSPVIDDSNIERLF